jgi:2-dehydropantoate 2-reductase
VQPQLVTKAELHEPYDVVLFAVKAFALEAAVADFAPAVGDRTTIVPLLNGMRHMDLLDARFGAPAVMGGVAYVATTLDDAGRIVQVDPNLQQVIFGERDGAITPRAEALHAQLAGAGFEATLSPSIMQDMWEKWLVLSALGALTCLLRGNVGEIEAVPGGAALALRVLAETVAVVTAAGYPPREAHLARATGALTQPGAPRASSMYRDLNDGRPVEVEQILGDLIARGAGFGVDTPLLDAATAQLRIYLRRIAST